MTGRPAQARGVVRVYFSVRKTGDRRASRPAVRTAASAGIGMVLVIGLAGCTGGDTAQVKAAPVGLSVVPRNGSGDVLPDTPIVVSAAGGTLQNVTVRARGAEVAGRISDDGSQWRSRWALTPGTRYEVIATALGPDGRTHTVTGTFTTRTVERAVTASVEAPAPGETVGVGMPIIMRFDREITDRAAVERALEVRSSKPVVGAWHWFDGQNVVFRTREHWPAHTRVRLIAHLNGVRAVRDGYATEDLDLKFKIGEAHASVANAKTHRMAVYRDGKKIRDFPISMGRGGVRKYTTTNGHHLTMEKGNPVIMDSSTVGCPPGCPGHYRLTVNWAVRISSSGEYTHSAPWSLHAQGHRNVSHGCINMSPSAARWFYHFSYRGDPFRVVGTNRELEPTNGWGYWQLGWDEWVKGSALKQALSVGPHGSEPVREPLPQAEAPATPAASPSALISPQAGGD